MTHSQLYQTQLFEFCATPRNGDPELERITFRVRARGSSKAQNAAVAAMRQMGFVWGDYHMTARAMSALTGQPASGWHSVSD